MICYGMLSYDMTNENQSMRFYAMVWDCNALLCYGVWFKRYAWTDCIFLYIQTNSFSFNFPGNDDF